MTADQDVANHLGGNSGPGSPALPEALVAMLYDAHILGLGADYAYPEGPNTTSSRYDQITTLAKVLTRKVKHADGNSYDVFDAVQTILKWVLTDAPSINDDEVNSVNHKTAS